MFRIFKIVTDSDPAADHDHMLGAYISTKDNDLLTLFALYRRTSKSLLYREIFADWFASVSPLSTLVSELGEQCYHIWCADYKVSTNEKQGLTTFRKALKQDLKSRNLSDDVVEKIIKKFDGFNN